MSRGLDAHDSYNYEMYLNIFRSPAHVATNQIKFTSLKIFTVVNRIKDAPTQEQRKNRRLLLIRRLNTLFSQETPIEKYGHMSEFFTRRPY